MNEPDNDKPKSYMSYRGLGYTAMFAGIPLFVAIALMGGVVASMVLLMLGLVTLAVILFFAIMGTFFFFKVLCENNNKAPELFKLKINGLVNILTYGKIAKVDLGIETDEQRKKFRQQFKCLFKP